MDSSEADRRVRFEEAFSQGGHSSTNVYPTRGASAATPSMFFDTPAREREARARTEARPHSFSFSSPGHFFPAPPREDPSRARRDSIPTFDPYRHGFNEAPNGPVHPSIRAEKVVDASEKIKWANTANLLQIRHAFSMAVKQGHTNLSLLEYLAMEAQNRLVARLGSIYPSVYSRCNVFQLAAESNSKLFSMLCWWICDYTGFVLPQQNQFASCFQCI